MNILITEGMGHIGKNLINKLSNTKIIITTNEGKIQEFTQSARNNKYWVERLKTRISLYQSKRQESQYG